MRLGTFPLRLLEFGQNRAPLLLKKGQLVLLSLLACQRHNNQFTQFGKRLLPVGKFGKIGSHQHRTLGSETFAASDDALQRTLRVPTIRLFDVQALFGQGAKSIDVVRARYHFRYRSAAHFLETFRTWYGPVQKAFAAAAAPAKLEAELLALLEEANVGGPTTLVAPSDYLQVVVTRA